MKGEFACPLCKAVIPLPATSTPGPDGMSVAVDMSAANEHIEMHRNCTCTWVAQRLTIIDADCPVHVTATGDVRGIDFPDIYVEEE